MSRVYVGRLPPRCSERDVERFFKGYGRLRDIVLKNGYGFVEFDDYKDADDAVNDLHGRELKGERLLVEHARLPPGQRGSSRRSGRDSGRRYGPPTRTEYRVIVENLSSRVSWQDLKDMMRKAGEVTYADAHKSARNEGIVEFATFADMKAAIEKFDGYTLYERRLRVYEDKPRRRSRSDSRDRSRSYSGRGSRRSRSRGSRRRERSRSRSHRKEESSSGRSNSRDRSRRDRSEKSEASRRSRSKSISRRSEKSPSRHSRRSTEPASRSPSRNGDGSVKGGDARSASGSRSRSHSHSPVHSRSRSRSDRARERSHSDAKSQSRSRSRSHSQRSATPEPRHSDAEMNDQHSGSENAEEN
uniref:RRM domain-containing protein n=1 Tax=Schistocephalus solidus TaxID=70667 RepID=A0A0X3PVV0_SCHSO